MPDQVSVRGRRFDAGWISIAARAIIGLVFAFSGFTKVVDIDGTIRSVRAYRLLPEAIVPTVGTVLPVLELALAVLLLTGLLTWLAAIITVPVSAAFFIGVASAWARGLTIECGCFGNGGPTAHPVPGYIRELVLNAVLVAAAIWLIRHPVSRWSLDSILGLSTATSDLDDPDDLDDLDDLDTLDDLDGAGAPPDHGVAPADDGPSNRSIGVQK